MERKEQTGHICRWMACGIMAAVIIVGCTILIGLFEWRDRKEIEYQNAELHEWRKNVHELNMHIAELSLLGLVMFLLVRRNKKRTDRLIGELNKQNKQNVELIKLRRQTIQAITHEL